jgi:hypothetical protein
MGESEQLIARYIDSGMSEIDRARLSELVRTDPTVRERLKEAARLHGLLLKWSQDRAARVSGQRDLITFPETKAEKRKNGRRLRRFRPALLAMAASLLILLGLASQWRAFRPNTAVARVTSESELFWGEGTKPESSGWLSRGKYQLRAGVARIQTESGAIISMAGPASFEFADAGELRLHSGKIVARMLSGSSKLRVVANGLDVVDLGTAFGVNTDATDGSLLSVLDGQVAVRAVEQTGKAQVISAGSSIRLALGDGLRPTAVTFDRVTFADLWPLTLGVDAVSSLVRFLPPGPYDNPLVEYRSDTHIFLMPERQGIELTEPVLMDAYRTNREVLAPGATPIPLSDQRVDSYLLFFNPANASIAQPISFSGQITFNRPIIGLIFRDRELESSDAALGVAGLNYRAPSGRRGLESLPTDLPAQDFVQVSADGRRLFFNLHVSFERDQLRVILKSERPRF